MNTNQMGFVILESENIVSNLAKIYGCNDRHNIDQLFLICIIQSILDEAEWYDLNSRDKSAIQNILSKIIRDNKNFVFDIPSIGIYSNVNVPQNSFTYDNIITY